MTNWYTLRVVIGTEKPLEQLTDAETVTLFQSVREGLGLESLIVTEPLLAPASVFTPHTFIKTELRSDGSAVRVL